MKISRVEVTKGEKAPCEDSPNFRSSDDNGLYVIELSNEIQCRMVVDSCAI